MQVLSKPHLIAPLHACSIVVNQEQGECALEVQQRVKLTSNLRFLYCTHSTLLPTVGVVTTVSPRCSLYNVVVFPALSKPTWGMMISFQHEKHYDLA